MNKLPRREFLQLSKVFDADKHDPVGMAASEKLDCNRPRTSTLAT